ncbi:2OG-Fe(II) oxygenase [Paucibacter sp. DJ4R-1]|nr:2OG-Fe(II) oxygenase [Paucibacter sp. DJ4R-1]
MILASQSKALELAPFRYGLIAGCMEPTLASSMLEWLEEDAPWKLRVADFYEQHEFSFDDVVLPDALAEAFSNKSLDELRQHMESRFEVELSTRIDITAHRLTHGQRIRIHNDFIPGEESHRLLIQLNRGWKDANGGLLCFFNSNDPSDVHRILRPVHNTGVVFEISKASLHAVTPIQSGDRYTLVLSFFPRAKCSQSANMSSSA